MVIESVRLVPVEKPWGRHDPSPWSLLDGKTHPIGELWFQRTEEVAPHTSLLLKLILTSQPLSIQVHPTDVFARSLGLKNGKTEAWYILSAASGSSIAIGLTRRLTASQLRGAIMDGSIVDLVNWLPVAQGDFIFVPAGTIHAIGAGLVVAEVQQRSDTTFRLFDFGRGRALDVDDAVKAAYAGAAGPRLYSSRIDDGRTLLVSSAYFTLELIDLPPSSNWAFCAGAEAWIFALQGNARLGETDLKAGEAIFAQMASVPMNIGTEGLKCLVAYAESRPRYGLLRNVNTKNICQLSEFSTKLAFHEAKNSWVRSTGITL